MDLTDTREWFVQGHHKKKENKKITVEGVSFPGSRVIHLLEQYGPCSAKDLVYHYQQRWGRISRQHMGDILYDELLVHGHAERVKTERGYHNWYIHKQTE